MRSSFAIASLLSAASAVSAADWTVNVGSNGLNYSPNTVNAAVDDTITFQFSAGNHTATQSTFANPCSAMEGGVGSGFRPSSTQPAPFVVTVNATTPLWFYCGQKNPVNHCQAGMVFAVNPPTSGNTFDAFQTAAKASGSASSSASGSSGSATGTSSGSSAATGTSPASTTSSTAKANAAMKVGGGGAAGALTAMALLVGFAL